MVVWLASAAVVASERTEPVPSSSVHADGVTCADQGETVPLCEPTSGVTRKRYAEPFVRPVTVSEVAEEAVWE